MFLRSRVVCLVTNDLCFGYSMWYLQGHATLLRMFLIGPLQDRLAAVDKIERGSADLPQPSEA